MVRSINPTIVHEAIYPDDPDGTVWRYRIPTLAEDRLITRAAQAGTSNGAFVVDGAAQEAMALRLCMEPPSGFLDEQGNEVEWDTQGHSSRRSAPSDKYLQQIPPPVRSWLSGLIQSGTSMTKEEAGNS